MWHGPATVSVGGAVCLVGRVQPRPAGQRGHAHPAPVRKGSKALRGAVVEAGQAAGRTRTYLGAVYHRLAGRRGKQRAAVATGRHILVAAYHILKTPERWCPRMWCKKRGALWYPGFSWTESIPFGFPWVS